jgi:hypothetical protein
MRPIVGRVAGLIPANFGPRAIMHFLLAARRKIVQELHDRRRRQLGLQLGTFQGISAHPVQPRQVNQPGEPAPGRGPGALQRPPLPVVIPAAGSLPDGTL